MDADWQHVVEAVILALILWDLRSTQRLAETVGRIEERQSALAARVKALEAHENRAHRG